MCRLILTTLLFVLLALVPLSPLRASDIPTVYITTADGEPVLSRDVWRERTALRIVMPDGTVTYESKRAGIRCRGNSTFDKPKKPYALRLGVSAALLGMPAGKRWVLLANFMDHSLLRNKLALEIARQTSLAWTSDSRMVNVVVNGEAMGCYQLCQQIRVGRRKVDTSKRNGYLLEIDRYPDSEYGFKTRLKRLPVNVKYPKMPTARQMRKMKERLDEVERMLYEDKTQSLDELFRTQLDMQSFADWYIVHELAQNAEPNGPRSCYLYKGKDGLLKAGPVWDFDLAFISVGLDDGGDIRPSRMQRKDVRMLTGDVLYNERAWWFDRLLQDTAFRSCVAKRWKELKPRFVALVPRLDEWHDAIKQSAEADEALWKGQDPARFDTFTSFESSFANLKRVYLYRIERLDSLLEK